MCGGTVWVPAVWYGVIPPTPTCKRCGAVATQPQLPVIPMIPRGNYQVSFTGRTLQHYPSSTDPKAIEYGL